MLSLLESLTGAELPAGYDFVVYVLGAWLMVYVLESFYGIIRMLIGHFLR